MPGRHLYDYVFDICFGLEDLTTPTDSKLFKVTDILGRETKVTKNEALFYIYDDGTVEKKIIIE